MENKNKGRHVSIIEYEGKQYKKCNNCLVTKEILEFGFSGYQKSGLRQYKSKCKYCTNLIARNQNKLKPKGRFYKYNKAAYERNREKTLVKNMTEEQIQARREKDRKRYWKNREKVLERVSLRAVKSAPKVVKEGTDLYDYLIRDAKTY